MLVDGVISDERDGTLPSVQGNPSTDLANAMVLILHLTKHNIKLSSRPTLTPNEAERRFPIDTLFSTLYLEPEIPGFCWQVIFNRLTA